MSRLVLVVLAILAVGGFSEPLKNLPPKFHSPHRVADKAFLKKQLEIFEIFANIHEPLQDPERKTIAETWSLEKNMDQYTNTTAVKIYMEMMQRKWILPRQMPFSVFNPTHLFEAKTLYNVFYSCKNYDCFYKTALFMRDRVNEYIFVYAFDTAIFNYPETQDIIFTQLYEVFPSHFFNGQIMKTAERISTNGKSMMDSYSNTFLLDNSFIIKWNETVWPYNSEEFPLAYFTNDLHLNALYYYFHICSPFWISGDVTSTAKLNRGEYFWFFHKQYLTHYYMERLSNGLGEIPELNFDMIEQGYESGLVYYNGIPFPTRPNDLDLKQPMFNDYIKMIKDVEGRLRDAIDMGYVIDKNGERVSIRSSQSLDLLGKIIEGNVDSLNLDYYKDIVSLWKMLLGNSYTKPAPYVNGHTPLIVPSALENFETMFRDPAYYMIWKRVLKFFNTWSSYLPAYTPEQLKMPSVKIESVEVDKLVTYFENMQYNVTKNMYWNMKTSKDMSDEPVVLVQQAVLNHKPFNIRVHVKSEVAKTVDVRFFLAPKYDSKGVEIPLQLNTFNFFQMDQFVYNLPAGESSILRESNQNMYMVDKWSSSSKIYEKVLNAYNGKEEYIIDESEYIQGYPRRLMIPKGQVGGMDFILMVYIYEHKDPKDPYGTGANPANTYGFGSGSRRQTSYPLNFPIDRPLYEYQIQDIDNMFFEEVKIYHKPTAETYNPYH